LFVRWSIASNSAPNPDYQDRLRDKLRSLANNVDLLMQEEISLAVAARFGIDYHPSTSLATLNTPEYTIVHLGFDRANMLLGEWYAMVEHPYHRAIAQVLTALTQLSEVSEFKFFVPSPLSDSEASTQTINTSHEQVFDPQKEWQPGIVYHYK
ncbi:MAG: bifunctional 3,4-dihydroxy-2-butanone-4-phosphate synthase/GTP cyclohydrolase II, partial [Pseudanabaena sp. SU_2_4]|nr:bifunctional 3,4-dihydroxy-2-butanone-4-phosphate synthase/GTP cyclohydrolase II [Pseudanabaena sp. SU_2_4]